MKESVVENAKRKSSPVSNKTLTVTCSGRVLAVVVVVYLRDLGDNTVVMSQARSRVANIIVFLIDTNTNKSNIKSHLVLSTYPPATDDAPPVPTTHGS